MESGPYGQIILFGDSITEQSANQEYGFAFMPALQNSRLSLFSRSCSCYSSHVIVLLLVSLSCGLIACQIAI